MIRQVRGVTALVIGAVALFAACTDVDRLPTAGEGVRQSVRLVGTRLVAPAERATLLGAPITWTFTVGPEGGVSRNDDAGLTIVVPPGALRSEQTFTVTALAGASSAYRFEPHVTFDIPVQLVQDLSRLRLGQLVLFGAHFDGDALEITNGKVVVNEVVTAVTSQLNGTVTIAVEHFSGWLPTSGNENPPKDSSGTS
jgi:hypothetical protein